ncbi:hypothetical protein TWF718_004918 [Orbilia javanica]|uniref:Uncharacterized protein n=1 Tax=Orbilia javanica TaxID=47235 RepID=A0AAN8N3H6_9PEZI
MTQRQSIRQRAPAIMHTEARAQARRQRLEERNRKLDEAIAAASVVVDSSPINFTDSDVDENERTKEGAKTPEFMDVEESEAEPESSAMAWMKPKAVPKAAPKALSKSEQEYARRAEQSRIAKQWAAEYGPSGRELRAAKKEKKQIRRRWGKEEEKTGEEPVDVIPRTSVKRNCRDHESGDEQHEKKRQARYPVRSQKVRVPMKILKGCIDSQERLHLSSDPQHSLNSPDGSPVPPPDATKYDVDWLIDAIRESKPIYRQYTKLNNRPDTKHGNISASDPLDMKEEMEIIAAKEKQLEADFETLQEIRYKERGQKPSLTLSVNIGQRLYCIERNLEVLREFKEEREEYWKKIFEGSIGTEQALQEHLDTLRAFNAERDDNKLRPKAQQEELSDSSSSYPAKDISREPTSSLETSPAAKYTPQGHPGARVEPKDMARLTAVCQIVEEKQRELEKAMAQAQKLQEELMLLSAEVEKISLEELELGEKEKKSPMGIFDVSSSSSSIMEITKTSPPVVEVHSIASSPKLGPSSLAPAIQNTSSPSTGSNSDAFPGTKLGKQISQSPTTTYLLSKDRRSKLASQQPRQINNPVKKKDYLRKGHAAKQIKPVTREKPVPETKQKPIAEAKQKDAGKNKANTKPASILPAKRKQNTEPDEPVGKAATVPGSHKRVMLQKEMRETIDDLETFFEMDAYNSRKRLKRGVTTGKK